MCQKEYIIYKETMFKVAHSRQLEMLLLSIAH